MNHKGAPRNKGRRRKALYTFDEYNPYQHTRAELPLVQENLNRLKGGEIDLRGFLRRTPRFARWREEHLRTGNALLITCGMEHMETDRLISTLAQEKEAARVGDLFQEAALSWLCLSDHPETGEIPGEPGWREGEDWEERHPLLARCGKGGYFIAPEEGVQLGSGKILHLTLYPYAQEAGEINPRNEQTKEYHLENLLMIRRFCEAAKAEERFIFIVGNTASIREESPHTFCLETAHGEDERCKRMADVLRVVEAYRDTVQARICRQRPVHGRDAQIMNIIRAATYELRPLREGGWM